MAELTSRERFALMYNHKEADRVPVIDTPWSATVERWQSEGMPKDVHYTDFFGLDKTASIGVDITPQYEAKTIEENEEYRIFTTKWGATLKDFKHKATAPEFMDFTIVDPDSWAEAKKRMSPDKSRVNWDHLKENYPKWKESGAWISAGFWFGFDVTHSWTVGTERLLMAMVTDPEWITDMFNHFLDMDIALFEMVLAEGYEFDCISWPDDMGYKLNQFFSVDTYRNMLKPVHARAIEWAHSKGAKAHLHSCGDIRPLVPELVEIGLDALNPLEVKAGMDPLRIKDEFGDKLVLHGGVNAVLWDKPDKIKAEMQDVIPGLKKGGGYIFSSDHSVPSSVSLEDFRGIVEYAKELGRY